MTVNLVPGTRLQRQFWRVYRVGDAAPVRHQWSCRIDVAPDGLDVSIADPDEAAPDGRDDDDSLEKAAARLHEALAGRLPRALSAGARSEAGVVSTRTWHGGRSLALGHSRYTLATSADVLLTLTDGLSPAVTTSWRGTCTPGDIDPDLPVALGPSAVLSLTAGVLELTAAPGRKAADGAVATAGIAVPGWMSVDAVHSSPYPPHDWPLDLAGGHGEAADAAEAPEAPEVSGGRAAAVAWWATRSDHWMRPMRTTRASRGQYRVGAALPPVRDEPSALWIESLVSLDTLGRCWQASLSIGRGAGRWWLAQPLSLEFRAYELLRAAVARLEPQRPALDRDPVDGECFGWAPGLLTSCPARELGLGLGRRA